MQKIENTLVMSAEELRTPEGGAMAKSALDANQGLIVGDLSVAKRDGKVVLTAGTEQTVIAKTAAEVVDAIVAYRTADRILAVLAADEPAEPNTTA